MVGFEVDPKKTTNGQRRSKGLQVGKAVKNEIYPLNSFYRPAFRLSFCFEILIYINKQFNRLMKKNESKRALKKSGREY